MDRKNFIRRSTLAALGTMGSGMLLPLSSHAVSSSPGEVIINAGVNGNNTTNLLKRIDADCLVHKPELVIIMVGTNDMNHGKFVAPDKYKANLESLADQVLRTNSKLLLMSILPFYEPYLLTRHPAEFFQPEGAQARRKAMNDIVQKVAAEKRCSFFDIGDVFERVGKVGLHAESLIRNEANVGKTDGVHPTRNGYRFIGVAVSQFILYHQLPTNHIVCLGDSITKGDGSVDNESYPAYLKKMLA